MSGDVDAFEAIFREAQQDVYRWLLRMVRDHAVAEDLVIETFWRVHRSRATFDARRGLQPWIRQIATNVARDHLGRRRLDIELPEALPQSRHVDSAPSEDVQGKVRRAVASLPPTYRIVVMLALADDLPHGEIADALGVPVGTVKSRLFHAVRLLRRKLHAMGVER